MVEPIREHEREQLNALQRAKVRRLSQPKELNPDEEGGELNIVPFLDIITNVLMFVLATVTVTFTTMIDAAPPSNRPAPRSTVTKPTLSLNVIVLKEGFVVSAYGNRVGPGCTSGGAGLAVAFKDEGGKRDYDWKGLSECAARLKALNEESKAEKQVAITASREIPYQVIVSTMDALRKDDKGQLMFPEVNFGVAK